MGKQNKRLWGAILVLTIITILSASFAFAGDLKVAVSQTKPVMRGNSEASTIDLRGSTNISKKNPRITLSLKNTDVKPVLRMFADKAGLNIILHPSVNGFVNIDLVNVPLNDAFRMVLQITDLTYSQDGNTIIVSSSAFARTSGISKQAISTVPIKYVDASLMANFLNQNIFSKKTPGLSNWDVVVTNATRNELLVFGTQNDLAMVKKVVAKLDVPPLNTTFTVKHTTPAEMATLVCRMLMMTQGPLDQGSQSVQWDYSTTTTDVNNSGTNGRSTGFAANIKPAKSNQFFKSGVVTGFASSGGSGGGSSGGGSGGSAGGSSGSIKLGSNVVACVLGGTSGTSVAEGGSSSGAAGGAAGTRGTTGGQNGNTGVGSAFSTVTGGVSGGSASLKLRSFGEQKMIVSYFPQRGTVNILGGSKNLIDKIADFIKENDIKQPQALLDITIIELNEDGQKDFTNSWTFASRDIEIMATTDGATSAGVAIGPNSPRYVFQKIAGAPQLAWYFNYLITNGKARVVANPKVLLTNGETSTIDLTSQYIDTVDAEIIQNSNTGNITGIERTYNKGDDLGLKFELVPFISPEGYISLNFISNYSTVKDTVTGALSSASAEQELVATLLNERKVNLNNIRIKDNETLMIGGLVQEQDTKKVSKIPFLGDIPVIGVVFRSTNTKKVKSELIILLTPRILKDTEDIGAEEPNTAL